MKNFITRREAINLCKGVVLYNETNGNFYRYPFLKDETMFSCREYIVDKNDRPQLVGYAIFTRFEFADLLFQNWLIEQKTQIL